MKCHLLLIFLVGFSLNCALKSDDTTRTIETKSDIGSADEGGESSFELKDGHWIFHDLSSASNTCGDTFIDTSNLQQLSDSLLPLEVVSSGGNPPGPRALKRRLCVSSSKGLAYCRN